MGLVTKDDGWRITDELWERLEPLLPERPPHPLGCHRSRVSDRAAMNAIFLVLRTGMQWNALSATGICSSSSAHRRFLEWTEAGVFREFWRQGLLDYQVLNGINWDWLAMDGAITKAPLGGEKNGPQSYGQRQRRHQAHDVDGRCGTAHSDRDSRSEPPRHEIDQGDVIGNRDSASHTNNR